MRRTDAKAHATASRRGKAPTDGAISRTTLALGIGWLVVPALQYVCSDQRMRLITRGEAPFEALALTDFTVGYLILLVITVSHITLSAMRSRGKGATS